MAIPADCVSIGESVWEIPRSHKAGMLVPARIIASKEILSAMDSAVLDQLTNVATLPGIVKYALCMPDGHSGYGFPVGGVAAMDPRSGVISPGGIGFDINCGMRLVLTNLTLPEITPKLRELVDALYRAIPSGVGGSGLVKVSKDEFRRVIKEGAHWCVSNGYGWGEDLERTEESGRVAGADPKDVSVRAIERGLNQLGTLGSGNHYLEIQVVREGDIADEFLASRFGIRQPAQVGVMFHCGSRGFGHEVATDYIQRFLKVMGPKYHIDIPDRNLACAPFISGEGQDYFSAMKCAANMAYANRQLILFQLREVFSRVFGRSSQDLGLHQVYDVSHNIARLEEHEVDGVKRELLVHRKGATRAFGPGSPDLPWVYKTIGQPIIIGGSMETGSYLLCGTKGAASTFSSTTHGSGRVMSRKQARCTFRGADLVRRMHHRGIYVRTGSFSGVAEEAGGAYKDIDKVVRAASSAGISRPVARFSPIGNIKG